MADVQETTGAAADNSPWQGRVDGAGPEHLRVHQAVCRPGTTVPDAGAADRFPAPVALMGFRSDEGVRRNHGRTGAADAPEVLRRALAPLALPAPLRIADHGDVVVRGTALEAGQEELGEALARHQHRDELTVVLGGGHETAWGSYLGLRDACAARGHRLGILNLDAHFDLRRAQAPSSGTPFLQIAEDRRARGEEFDYAVLGISDAANTPALFRTAADWDVRHLADEDAQDVGPAIAFVDDLLRRVDELYLTIDLDVLPAAVAPGVSAPATLGVPMAVALAACTRAAGSGKLRHLDVVELNPRYDVDRRTARHAARLIHRVLTSHRRSPATH